jgi:double-stranded uracil-DNA glycosylase
LATYEPDVLAEDLEVVFCGINPATTAATGGHSFSNGSNRFWTALHLAGFTDRRLPPHEERRLLAYGCGITAVVDRLGGPMRSRRRNSWQLGSDSRPMRRYAPRSIAFLGKRAVSTTLGQPELPWGRLPGEFAGTMAWSCQTRAGSTGASRSMGWWRPMPSFAWRCAPMGARPRRSTCDVSKGDSTDGPEIPCGAEPDAGGSHHPRGAAGFSRE